MTKGNHAQRAIRAMTDDGIRFSLFAPRVKQVAIQGSWNDFNSVPMQQTANGVWWISFPLHDGEYQYRFEVIRNTGKPKRVLVADPTGIRFADKYSCSVIRIVNGQPVYYQYQWKHDDVDLVPNEQLIIYEMHIGDFRGGPGDDIPAPGTFERVIAKLDYLTELGINALEFMPVTQAMPDDNWGYSQHSLYSVDNTFGTPDELARLVDECHKRGIRVIHDGVYNHLHENAPLPLIDYTYWFYEDNPDEEGLQFGPKFNFEYQDKTLEVYPAREHILGAMHRWIGSFRMDGIRFDSTRALKHFDVLSWLNEESHSRAGFKPFFTIAEHLPQDPSITGTDGPIDAAWHDNFYRQLNCTVLGVPYDNHNPLDTTELLRVLNAKTDGFTSNYNTIHYLNNHDQERTMHLLDSTSKLSGEAAFRRNKLGATLLMTAPGIPMLWMGEEFGQESQRGEYTDQKPLDWSLLHHEQNRNLWQHYRRLIALRKENLALCSDNFEPLADMPERGIIAFKRWDDVGNIIVIVANLIDQAVGEVEIQLKGVKDVRWRDVLNNTDIQIRNRHLVTTLAESEVKIYLQNLEQE
jgi:1,4-alpha-glucan branching enzyme